MRKDLLVFGQPDIRQEDIDEVVDSLEKYWLGTGPKVERFEKDFARYKGIKYSTALYSCTAALHLAILTLNLKPGDEIIVPAMTFCATVNAVIHSGATPVLADVDPLTLNITQEEIEKKRTDKTKAVIIVHFAGRPCELTEIINYTSKNRIAVIEDCAHAIETLYKGKHAGTFGRFGCFSFYSTKNVVTGEGGMIISNDKDSINRVKILALHGMSADAWSRFSDKGYKHYFVKEAGFKYNMMDLQAALGIHQLKRVEKNWKKRAVFWKTYIKELQDTGLVLPAGVEQNTRHAYHLFTIRVNKKKNGLTRDQFLEKLTEKNIGTGVHYNSITEHPYYRKNFSWENKNFPNAFTFGRETISLPISPRLEQSDIEDVIEAVKSVIN